MAYTDNDEVTPHEDTKEFRYFGPPGTGKTTTLSRQIKRAAQKYGAKSVLVTSFSKAAAAELVSRDLPCPKEQIGTLHAICWRAMSQPKIAESNVQEWNKRYPHRAISRAADSPDDYTVEERAEAYPGDAVFGHINYWRGRMIPPRMWSDLERTFWKHWTDYKQQNALMDFNDLLEQARRDFFAAPGRPSVIFADEAQDLNALQLDLIRHWGKQTDYFITSGDDDQMIYGFIGCTPKAMLEPKLPDYAVRVLDQSYRVPFRVHQFTQRWIGRVKERQPKLWKPREEEGTVKRIGDNWKWPALLIDNVIGPEVSAGRTVMVLASCSYMLSPLVSALREAAVPFWNPYRRRNGLWNPISQAEGGAASRALSLLSVHPSWPDARRWRVKDLALITEWIAVKIEHDKGKEEEILIRGAKANLTARAKKEGMTPVTAHDLAQTFAPATLDVLINSLAGASPDLLADWWQKRLASSFQKRSEYPLALAMKHGREALTEEPKVIVGTIHSVKGGQADTVIVFPDLSSLGEQQKEADPDSITRLFYVAMTRAKQRLYICHPGHTGSCGDMWAEAGLKF